MNTHLRTRTSNRRPSSAAERGGPQSVGRVFSILESLAATRSGATLTELAAKADAPKTSLVGLLAGLTAEGCLERDSAGRYRLGPRFISLAMQAATGREIVALARPIMVELVEATGETAVLGVLAPDADLALYLDRVESSNPIRYAVTVGERRDLYCTAIGKVLLAYFDDHRLERYLKSAPRKRFTSTTITSRRALLAEIAGIRRDGIARTSDERVKGASGLAAPIFGATGSLAAALLIAGPSDRMRAHVERNQQLLRRAADECTHANGGKPPSPR